MYGWGMPLLSSICSVSCMQVLKADNAVGGILSLGNVNVVPGLSMMPCPLFVIGLFL